MKANAVKHAPAAEKVAAEFKFNIGEYVNAGQDELHKVIGRAEYLRGENSYLLEPGDRWFGESMLTKLQ